MNDPLWTFRPDDTVSVLYAWFNVLEGLAWMVIAGYVMVRFVRLRRSWWEVAYAGLFVLFGLSDWRESYVVQPWLILAKGVVLAGILLLRRYLIRRHYPGYRF